MTNNALKPCEWISVNDRLPEIQGHYLVFRDVYDDEWADVRMFNGINFVEIGHRLGSDEHQWIDYDSRWRR